MNSEDYFSELCGEAGEFVFTRVQNVEGVMQMRPRALASHEMMEHLYALEDPYGYREWEARNPESFFVKPTRYRFLERAVDGTKPTGEVIRHWGYDGRDPRSMKVERAMQPNSRYGFIWRGIRRENDRELGIAGGELIVLDINTFQVLGVKRGFARTGEKQPGWSRIWWGAPSVCPGDSRDIYRMADFVTKVLIPLQP